MSWSVGTASNIKSMNNAVSGTVSLSVSINDLVVLAVAMKDRTTWTIPSIRDDQSNEYSLLGSIKHTMGGADVDGCAMFAAVAGSTGTMHIILDSNSAGIYAKLVAVPITGYKSGDYFDAYFTGDNSATYNVAKVEVTATSNNPVGGLALAMMSTAGSGTMTISAGASGTVGVYLNIAEDENNLSGTYPNISFDYQELGEASTQAIAYAFTGNNEGASALLVFLNPATSSPVLSLPGVQNITATTAVPKVTLTY